MADITNLSCMGMLRDLGREVEDEAHMHATGQELMGENVFCESLVGGVDHDKIRHNMDAHCDATPAAERQREELREILGV